METEDQAPKPGTPTPALNVTAQPEIVAQQNAMMKRVAPSGQVLYFTPYDMVTAFHAAALTRGLCHIGQINKSIPGDVITGRVDLIDEEVNKELLPLLRKIAENGGASLEQKAALLDHAVDSVYVIMGMCINFGLFFDTAFATVHRANMAKVLRPEGPIFFEEGNPEGQPVGKIKKPEGWVAPDKALFNLCLEAFSELEKQEPGKTNNLPQPANDGTSTPALDEQPPVPQ